MWFYMKYIVKNHSDRILLARLCSSISAVICEPFDRSHAFFINEMKTQYNNQLTKRQKGIKTIYIKLFKRRT